MEQLCYAAKTIKFQEIHLEVTATSCSSHSFFSCYSSYRHGKEVLGRTAPWDSKKVQHSWGQEFYFPVKIIRYQEVSGTCLIAPFR